MERVEEKLGSKLKQFEEALQRHQKGVQKSIAEREDALVTKMKIAMERLFTGELQDVENSLSNPLIDTQNTLSIQMSGAWGEMETFTQPQEKEEEVYPYEVVGDWGKGAMLTETDLMNAQRDNMKKIAKKGGLSQEEIDTLLQVRQKKARQEATEASLICR